LWARASIPWVAKERLAILALLLLREEAGAQKKQFNNVQMLICGQAPEASSFWQERSFAAQRADTCDTGFVLIEGAIGPLNSVKRSNWM
jgi:hypothetical protein